MRISVIILATFVLCSAAIVRAEPIFFSTFDGLESAALLTGQTADSGQVWAVSPKTEVNDSRGKGSLDLSDGYGQASLGTGASKEGNYWQGNSVALGESISDGILTLTYDVKRHRTSGHNGSAEVALSLMGGGDELALIWNGGSLKIGGSVIGYDGGAWKKSLDMGISTGDVAVELVLDMDAQTGMLSYSQYGTDNSGSVALDAITQADIQFDTLLTTLRTIDETMGYDNIAIEVVPEPSMLGLLLLGSVALSVRRDRPRG